MMIHLELLCSLAVSSNDRLAMSTIEVVEGLHIVYSTRFDFTPDLTTTGRNLNRKATRYILFT